ncbi:putative apolipoprotein(a)-like protein 2 [Ostrea edulis]|uniref:putative apolipoprotein(a)-like protein 2 n=1 Tax=Ostrea edulis TaxID=37623 RepID=UPI0024AF1E26|nr:putative apolipoprotein(a)-like protein 2 [Ostrea edulis]
MCIAHSGGKKSTCIAARCLGEPPPGQLTSYVANTSESYVGSSRGYACAVGTVPERVNQTTCLANGHWETPRCQVCIEASDPTGATYWGTKNVTKTGKTCQRWNSQSPQQHDFPNNPICHFIENYCRNPDSHTMPWCYTMDPDIRWEECSIPTC